MCMYVSVLVSLGDDNSKELTDYIFNVLQKFSEPGNKHEHVIRIM